MDIVIETSPEFEIDEVSSNSICYIHLYSHNHHYEMKEYISITQLGAK